MTWAFTATLGESYAYDCSRRILKNHMAGYRVSDVVLRCCAAHLIGAGA